MITIQEANDQRHPESRLTVKVLFRKESRTKCICDCICGKEVELTLYALIHGRTKSCGCYSLEMRLKTVTKYYPVIKPLYKCWSHMIERCYDPKDKGYSRYGGRGVKVCDEWKNDYQKFLDWALANGWAKGLQIDKDIKGNGILYSPENCCFVTAKVNCNNRRSCKHFDYNGERLTIQQIAEKEGLYRSSIMHHVNRNKTVYEAVQIMINKRK